ncbi:hypothetical protein [Ochrobactrum vermis]|uniref:hypothetical protein n=1 Tax=Ochrobactrum vermis TaxID=1827297 RepID=UPI000CFD6B44|nr:hypothetical protein [Ochrobactrum vermis]PQZ25806.1 hypothetical protein CQZ93_17430 [Ochrobactrum vermis]
MPLWKSTPRMQAEPQRFHPSCCLSDTEIREARGNNNLSNFNRYFLQETGLTPRAYRNAAHIRDSPIAAASRPPLISHLNFSKLNMLRA